MALDLRHCLHLEEFDGAVSKTRKMLAWKSQETKENTEKPTYFQERFKIIIGLDLRQCFRLNKSCDGDDDSRDAEY